MTFTTLINTQHLVEPKCFSSNRATYRCGFLVEPEAILKAGPIPYQSEASSQPFAAKLLGLLSPLPLHPHPTSEDGRGLE